MGDKEREDDHDLEAPRKRLEPEPGKGSRSLAHWQNLAKVRQSLSANRDAQDQYRLNPVGYMQRFGVDMAGALPARATGEGGARLGIEPAAEGAEMQLAFCKVWGCVIVVAGAVANAAAVSNAVANANLTANVNGMNPGDTAHNDSGGGAEGAGPTGSDDGGGGAGGGGGGGYAAPDDGGVCSDDNPV